MAVACPLSPNIDNYLASKVFDMMSLDNYVVSVKGALKTSESP